MLARILSGVGLVCVLAGSAAAQTGVTIYNDGRVLVRRTFLQRVPAGASTQAVSVGMADPATLFSLDSDVNIERATYDAAVDEQSVLRRSVGRRHRRSGTLWRALAS